MLSRLPFGIEGAAYLCTTERAVVEQSAVVAGERYALGHALVDDGTTDLCQAVHIGLTGAVVSAFDGVAEEAFYAVAVVLVVFCCVDAALGGNAMGATWRVLDTEDVDVEA